MTSRERYRDPVAYRIDYSLAAQILHAVSEERDREVPGRVKGKPLEPPEQLGETLEMIQRQLLIGEGDPGFGFEHARDLALRLIRASARELLRQGWRWPGRRPAWFVRRPRSRSDRRLAEFLDRVLEPTTVVLFWSCQVELEEPPSWEDTAPGRPDRRLLVDGPEEGRAPALWLAAYLAEMLEPEPESPQGLRLLLARIGVSRWRRRAEPNPRVRYNLACLYSRLAARRYVDANEDPRERLRRSAEQLREALEGMKGRQREALARWAQEDPGLQGLRSMDSPFAGGRDLL
ncbi:MAG: hypothetical protein M3Y75_12540 [Actinomycetota bacterium]|nr:hypothetical protein [Actinomycetota bacterium]